VLPIIGVLISSHGTCMKNNNIKTATLYFLTRSSPFGPVALIWSVYKGQPKIFRALISTPNGSANHRVVTLFPDSQNASCSEIDAVADDIERFLSGEDTWFSLEIVRMDLCTKFQKKVLHAEHGIPRGFVSTYQLIARHVGRPKGARAVGNALATNPFPLIIPCHRAIRTDLTIGGYQGGIQMKQALLKMEGIDFNENGHVATKNFVY
jgi:methylated-DNA-[protein]-cysteine S-methyltransferase